MERGAVGILVVAVIALVQLELASKDSLEFITHLEEYLQKEYSRRAGTGERLACSGRAVGGNSKARGGLWESGGGSAKAVLGRSRSTGWERRHWAGAATMGGVSGCGVELRAAYGRSCSD